MKFSFRQLLLLVALAATPVFAHSEKGETLALQGDSAADLSTLEIGQPSREVASPEVADPNREISQEDSRFAKATMAAANYAIKNKAFVMQRAFREVLVRWVKMLSKQYGFAQKLTLGVQIDGKPVHDAQANKVFVSEIIDGTVKSAIVTALKTIKTDEEHWFLSMAVAGITDYCFERDFSHAVLEALRDYWANPDAVQHWPQAQLLFKILPFINADIIVEHLFGKNGQKITKPGDLVSWTTGIWISLAIYLAWDPKTRVKSRFEPGSLKDTFFQNWIGRAGVPGAVKYVATSFFTPPAGAGGAVTA